MTQAPHFTPALELVFSRKPVQVFSESVSNNFIVCTFSLHKIIYFSLILPSGPNTNSDQILLGILGTGAPSNPLWPNGVKYWPPAFKPAVVFSLYFFNVTDKYACHYILWQRMWLWL